MRWLRLSIGLCSAIAVACGGGPDGAPPQAAPAKPDTVSKLKNELAAAVIASEASCSAAWLSTKAEPPCAHEPRRVLEGDEHAWMLANATIASIGAAAAQDASGELHAVHGRLLLERALRDAPDGNGLAKLAKSLGYADAAAYLSAAYGFDVRATVAVAQQLLNASEGLYLVARTDVGVATADADALTNKALLAPKTVELARALIDALLPTPQQPQISAITDAGSSAAGVFFVAPDMQRVIIMLASGVTDVDVAIRALARGRGRSIFGAADASLAQTAGFAIAAVLGSGEWMAEASGLGEPALTRIVRVQAYRALENARSDAAHSVDVLAADDGVASPLSPGDPWMMSLVRFRARLIAAEVDAALAAKLGPTWWQRPEAPSALAYLRRDVTSDTLLAKLGRSLTAETLLLASARALARSDALVSQR